MAHPLDGVRAKLERADEHLEILYGEVARFLYGKPYELVLEYDAENVTWIVHMRIHRDPPIRIATVAGDCIHNLRSALDHLVYALVEKAEGTPGKHTRFPLFLTETAWLSGHARNTEGLSPAMVAEIDALQPYHGSHKDGHPVTHPLWHLEQLWNWDKHNLLVPTVGSMEGLRRVGYSPNDDVGTWMSSSYLEPGAPVEDGTELFRMRYADPGPNPEMEMHGDITFDVTLSSGPPVPEFLGELASFVRGEVLPRFEPFF